MSKYMKRLLTFLVAVSMVVSMLPMTVLADDLETLEPEESVGPRDPAISGGTTTEPEEESDIQSLKVYPVTVIEGTAGFWDEDGGYYYYGWTGEVYYEVVMADGTYYEGTGGFTHNGVSYAAVSRDNQREDHWTAGNTYEATFSLYNESTGEEYTQGVSITVAPSPVASIVVNPLQMVKDVDGWINTNDNGDYFYYDWHNRITWTIFYKDGSVQNGTGCRIEYNGGEHWFDYSDPGQHLNPWTVGTYQIPMNFMGAHMTANVEIIETPIQDIVISPVELMPGGSGYMTEDAPGQQYFRYNWFQNHEYTIVFADGSTYTGTEGRFYYNGREYGLYFEDDQSYTNQWTSGNTYTGRISALGFTKKVPVTVAESPIKSLTIEPVLVYEKSSGQINTYYPEGPDGPMLSYYQYNWWNNVRYSVEFKDGSGWSGSGSGFNYQNQWFSFEGLDDQSYDNAWTVGNTYSAQVNIAGMTMPITVTVAANPVQDVVFEPITLKENENGWWNYGPDGAYFYYGDWGNKLKFTVYFNDGTSYTGQGWGFHYNNQWCSFSTWSNQSYDNVWLPGNTYEAYVDVMGGTYTVPINIYREYNQDGFNYLVQNDQAIINDCNLSVDTLQIPATLGGYPVTGITSLGQAANYATTIEIPDSVTMISENTFRPSQWTWSIPLEHLVLGAGITQIDVSVLSGARNLQSITVSANNPAYCAVDGVLYTKDMSTMVVYPAGKQETHVIPDSVANIDILFQNRDLYQNVSFQMGAGVENYVMEDGVIYNKDKTEIVMIPDGLTGDYVMPDTVTSIAFMAFANTDLTSVKLSKSVRHIAYSAFAGCKALETVTLPEGIESIGEYAFADCESLQSVEMPEGMSWVGSNAFVNCSSMRTVTVPSTMQYFDYNAFSGCNSLEAVYAATAERWMRINFGNNNANPLYFANNLYLEGKWVTELEIPSVITVIYDHAFAGFNISELTIPEQVFCIGEEAFYNSNIQRVYLSEGLYEIGSSAFESTNLQVLSLPDTVDYVGASAFAYCTALENVYMGTGLTVIEENTFVQSGLKSITIPKQVEYIGRRAFADSRLRYLDLQCDRVEIGEQAFMNCPLGDLEFGDNVTFMDERAFYGIDATTVKLPASVTKLTYRVFGYCNNLVSVTIPESITYIDAEAFTGSYNLSHVLYTGTEDQWWDVWCDSPEVWDAVIHCDATGDEVTTQMTCNKIIYTCSICNETRSVPRKDTAHNFEDGVCTICGQEGYWEYDVNPLSGNVTVLGYSNAAGDLVIPSAIGGKPVVAIAARAFANRSDITSVVIPDSVTRIGEGAFEFCNRMSSITLSKNLDRIEDNTFKNCYSLHSIELPEGVVSIGRDAFSGSALREVVLNEGLQYIDTRAFFDCWNLNELKLPSTVREISYYAFSCTNIWELVIPASVEEIKEGAFEYCYGLNNIYFQGDAIWSYGVFNSVVANAYYPASNPTWQDDYNPDMLGGKLSWIAVEPAIFFVQPEDMISMEAGEMTVNAVAKGNDITYQWYYAEAGSSDFRKAEQTGQSFTMMMNGENSGVRVYCEVTDVLGQVTRSNTATLTVMEGGILGDLDGSMSVDVDDVVSLLLHVSMPDVFPVNGPADFDKNGSVDVDDVVTLLLHVSMPDMFPLG